MLEDFEFGVTASVGEIESLSVTELLYGDMVSDNIEIYNWEER